MPDLAELSHIIAVEGYQGPGHLEARSDQRLEALTATGTELWLDSGNLEEVERVWRREFAGQTTNNTLVNQVVQTGQFDDLIRSAPHRLRGASGRPPTITELVMEIGFILNCRVALRMVERFGVQVSVELHPSLAHEIEESVAWGRRYHAVCSSHFLVKVPLTPSGYCVAARLESEGIPVNFTLGFSARQNYIAALFSRPHFVNVFLGRLNQVVAENHLGDGRNVGEKATLAAARAVREARAQHPEIGTRLIAASMRGASQVTDLAGVDVQTMPPKVAVEFLASEVSARDIKPQLAVDPQVQFGSRAVGKQVGVLWEIDERTRDLANDLLKLDPLQATDEDLMRAAQAHGGGLFYGFTPEEETEIAAKGKIPEFARWAEEVPLDELMTQAGLQSFADDQKKLDDRIRGLTG